MSYQLEVEVRTEAGKSLGSPDLPSDVVWGIQAGNTVTFPKIGQREILHKEVTLNAVEGDFYGAKVTFWV